MRRHSDNRVYHQMMSLIAYNTRQRADRAKAGKPPATVTPKCTCTQGPWAPCPITEHQSPQ